MANSTHLSVVIPSYNELVNLQKGVLDKVEHFLQKKEFSYEVIIVDDGSTDGSIEFVENFIKDNPKFILKKNHHSGKAGAVTKGMLSATGEYILFADMDQATPIEEVDKLLPYFSKDYDVVIGSRSNTRRGAPLSRQFISRAQVLLRKTIVGMGQISDTQCGFKAFKREAAQRIFTKVEQIHDGFRKISGSSVTSGFDVELLYVAKKMGYKIKEVPVNWLYVESRRVSPIGDSIDGVIALLQIRANAIEGIYN